jgi:hypothetical protein
VVEHHGHGREPPQNIELHHSFAIGVKLSSRGPVLFRRRRYFLDELPQFINLLQGRMSAVGPRPHAVAHGEMYRRLIKGYMIRHKVRPGITGWAQVNGFRGETRTLGRMESHGARLVAAGHGRRVLVGAGEKDDLCVRERSRSRISRAASKPSTPGMRASIRLLVSSSTARMLACVAVAFMALPWEASLSIRRELQ